MKTKSTEGKLIKKVFKWLFNIITYFVVISTLLVFLYSFIPVPVTPIMIIRVFENIGTDYSCTIYKDWVSYDEVSKNMFRACIAAEDGRFLRHDGIDWKAVKNARRYNEIHKGKKTHGASTISMQTAKNVFLTHSRNFIRKGLEAYFTTLIESVWGKKRILEVYVNVVELGDGIYGVEAASQHYFGKPANKLTKHQTALLAATLPNPRKYSASRPSAYVQRRAAWIEGRMSSIALPKD